jgi:hypothetical protein
MLDTGEALMKTRLNVTEAERLRYSHRRLRALSRLRDAGIEPVFGMYKDHSLPSSGRLSYRVGLPDGSDMYCQRLVDVEAFAEDYRRWRQTQAQPFAVPISFGAWQSDPIQRMLALVTAGLWPEQEAAPVYPSTHVPPTIEGNIWPQCRYPADGVIDGRPMCAAHAMVYRQMRLASASS